MTVSYIRKLQELGVYRKDIERLRYYQRKIVKASGGNVQFSTTAKELYENISAGHTQIEREIYNAKDTLATIREAEEEDIIYDYQHIQEAQDMSHTIQFYTPFSVRTLTLLHFSDDDFTYLVELTELLKKYIDENTGELKYNKQDAVVKIWDTIARLLEKYA